MTATGPVVIRSHLQNIPVRSELGRQILAAFIPDTACLAHYLKVESLRKASLAHADYSQIELRLLAHLSGNPAYGRVQARAVLP